MTDPATTTSSGADGAQTSDAGTDQRPRPDNAPTRLTVDHLTAPTGVAVERPVLAWQVPGTP